MPPWLIMICVCIIGLLMSGLIWLLMQVIEARRLRRLSEAYERALRGEDGVE